MNQRDSTMAQKSLSDQLREAIKNYGTYAAAKEAGITYPVIYRFINGNRGLSLATAEKLAEFFGMHLTRPTRKKPK